MESPKHLTIEFLAVMTMIGVGVAVLVLVIDQQIKRDIVAQATAARRSVDRLQELLTRKEGTDAGSTANTADSAD